MNRNINNIVSEINKLRDQKKFQEALLLVEQYWNQVNVEELKQLESQNTLIINDQFVNEYQLYVQQIKIAIKQNQQSLATKQLDKLRNYVKDHKTKGSPVTPENFNAAEIWIFYFDYFFKAERFFNEQKYEDALNECAEAKKMCTNTEEIDTLVNKIREQEEASIRENSYHGNVPLFTFNTINVPKKENEGEDADPYINGNNFTKWGCLAVFDGMGGAGARKYRHKDTGEEHTAAYWASRIVRNTIVKIFETRRVGDNPITRVNKYLHNFIKQMLDQAILDFPNANSNVLNKMSHKLPTTLAMAVYEIKEDRVNINSYWAGDSRVILLTKDRIIFLTIDDADAPDGDPISPQNMDLPMNNAIYQDSNFRINYSETEMKISTDEPFLLIASTDGCFGYFHNPIEFEDMMRKSISKAANEDEVMDNVKKAIIDNIQQDDFSMAMIAFGFSNFESFKSCLACKTEIEDTLATEYFNWRTEVIAKRSSIEARLDGLNRDMQLLKQELDSLHDEDIRENLNWYNRYKETITIVKRGEIKSVQ